MVAVLTDEQFLVILDVFKDAFTFARLHGFGRGACQLDLRHGFGRGACQLDLRL